MLLDVFQLDFLSRENQQPKSATKSRDQCKCTAWLQAEGHWEKALGLNPLFPQGWFALGYCCLKTQNRQRALQVSASRPPILLIMFITTTATSIAAVDVGVTAIIRIVISISFVPWVSTLSLPLIHDYRQYYGLYCSYRCWVLSSCPSKLQCSQTYAYIIDTVIAITTINRAAIITVITVHYHYY